jgi:Fe2+ or Zn2+ uptake regulation protein
LQVGIIQVLAGPDEKAESVVSVLHKLRETGFDPQVEAVREGLRALANKGVVESARRTVPVFRLAVARADLEVETLED